jgi:hypothetical protein
MRIFQHYTEDGPTMGDENKVSILSELIQHEVKPYYHHKIIDLDKELEQDRNLWSVLATTDKHINKILQENKCIQLTQQHRDCGDETIWYQYYISI